MKKIALIAAATLFAGAAFAEGDAAKGEADFKKCKSCHTIASADEVIFKGGKTGPNLYGIVGRAAGSVEDFKYSSDLKAAGEAGLVWDAASLEAFVQNPKDFLKETLGSGSAKSKMSFKLKEPADVIAYLASLSPAQ